MNNYKTMKFNGKLYPYADLEVYDYNLNRNRPIRISTEDLNRDVTQALFNGTPELKTRAMQVDPTIEFYVPESLLLTESEETVANFVSQHLSD